jgi:hypothetical protein
MTIQQILLGGSGVNFIIPQVDTFYFGSSLSDDNYVFADATSGFLEFKGSFIGSQNTPSDTMFAWMHFIDNCPPSATKLEFYDSVVDSVNPVASTTSAATATSVSRSLRNGTTYSALGWKVYLGCVNSTAWTTFTSAGGKTGGAFNNTTDANYVRYVGYGVDNSGGCVCNYANIYWLLRPHIGNSNWGGGTTQTCANTSRVMKYRIYY